MMGKLGYSKNIENIIKARINIYSMPTVKDMVDQIDEKRIRTSVDRVGAFFSIRNNFCIEGVAKGDGGQTNYIRVDIDGISNDSFSISDYDALRDGGSSYVGDDGMEMAGVGYSGNSDDYDESSEDNDKSYDVPDLRNIECNLQVTGERDYLVAFDVLKRSIPSLFSLVSDSQSENQDIMLYFKNDLLYVDISNDGGPESTTLKINDMGNVLMEDQTQNFKFLYNSIARIIKD